MIETTEGVGVAGAWPSTARPKLAREVFLIRSGPPPQTKDTWERALIEQARRLDRTEPLPNVPIILRDNLQYDRPHRLNYTAAQIVAWCDGRCTVADLEQKAIEHLHWTPEQAQQGVRNALDFLKQQGMLEGVRRRLQWCLYVVNPLRLARIVEYYVGYHVFHKYR
jgi:hypothetical protein